MLRLHAIIGCVQALLCLCYTIYNTYVVQRPSRSKCKKSCLLREFLIIDTHHLIGAVDTVVQENYACLDKMGDFVYRNVVERTRLILCAATVAMEQLVAP
jgi:hypothetical protein